MQAPLDLKESVENSIFPDDWKSARDVALKACRKGREVLLAHFGRLRHIEKKEMAGLVSEADRAAEEAILSVLREAYPHSEFLAEESDHLGAKVREGRAGPQGRWILDPLDGTTNYIHGFSVFCISLALEVEGDLKVAVVDVPLLGETYTAIRGQGAFLNGEKIQVSSARRIEDTLLATGFFAEDKVALQEQIAKFTRLVECCRGIRRAGAAAYDLCLVARGVFDGFWEKNLKPWDMAAGQLLVEEAGGVALDEEGQTAHPYKKFIVAGNAEIVSQILARFPVPSNR